MNIGNWIRRSDTRPRREYRAVPFPISREAFEAGAAEVAQITDAAWAALAGAAAETIHRRLARAMTTSGNARSDMVAEARGMADLWDALSSLRGGAEPAHGKGARR